MLNESHYEQVTIDSWDKLRLLFNTFNKEQRCIYRGQTDSTWKLAPTIERLNFNNLQFAEDYMFKLFSRNIHNYLSSNCYPDTNEISLEWLALMQHHGAPTRMLDWTYSPYIATFFAIDGSNEKNIGKYSAIWCIDPTWINTCAITKLGANIPDKIYSDFLLNDKEKFKDFILTNREKGLIIGIAEPTKANQRLNIQQGLFLFSNNLSLTFEEIFKDFCESKTNNFVESNTFLKKILIPNEMKHEILEELDLMNINHESLFPGIDGFARSLGNIATIRPKKVYQVRFRRTNNKA